MNVESVQRENSGGSGYGRWIESIMWSQRYAILSN